MYKADNMAVTCELLLSGIIKTVLLEKHGSGIFGKTLVFVEQNIIRAKNGKSEKIEKRKKPIFD